MDTDWANNWGDHKSTLGYAFKIAGRAISWSSKKQPTVVFVASAAHAIVASKGCTQKPTKSI
jgi:hypothetical protein